MCTPVHEHALVVGFLRAEGFIQDLDGIEKVHFRLGETVADIRLKNDHALKAMKRIKTSGLGGGPSFESSAAIPPVSATWCFTCDQIVNCLKFIEFGERSQWPGIHVSVLSDGEKCILRMEDIGRHNTIDKLWGDCLISGRATDGNLLVTTGRISSEMLLKAARMKVPVVVSLNSVTNRAVKLAKDLGITTIGYARSDRFSVYSHPERIQGCPAFRER
jgi:FdhD protein